MKSIHLGSLALLALFAACQTAPEKERSVSELSSAGEYDAALALAEKQAAEAPDDAYLQNVKRMAEVAVLMDAGRVAHFEGQLEVALEKFFQANAIAPDHVVINSWIDKTVKDLAVKTMQAAARATMMNELEAAETMYERVLVFDPESEDAKAGLGRTLLLKNHRKGMSEEYYKEGLRSMREYWLGQASTQFSAMGKYAPEDDRAGFRNEQIGELLGQDRVLVAKDFEEQELFHAARNEYRIALLIDPTNEEALRGFERLDREVQAFAKLSEAENAALRGDLDKAQAALVEGVGLTDAQRPEFVAAKIDIDEARAEELYQAGLDAEADGRYPAAVAKFDELLQGTGNYKDAVARRKTATDFIKLATRLYGEAMNAQEPKVKRAKLEQIMVFWPEYRDVAELLAGKP